MIQSRKFKSGITVVWTDDRDAQVFCQRIGEVAASSDMAIAVIHYSAQAYDAKTIIEELHQHAPELPYCGCSGSGEITPDGMQDGGAVAIMLPSRWFTVTASIIERVDKLGMHAIAQQAADQRVQFNALTGTSQPDNIFAMCLIDGISYAEEAVTSALTRGLGNIPLIGGSAADDLKFVRTTQICNGHVHTRATVLMLLQCRLPYQIYAENNFVPTQNKLVVTESNPEQRIVMEFNAEPAAVAYAKAIGLKPEELTSSSYASYSLVVRFGGEYYCRGIQRVNDDLSMTFCCAIDNGLVLTVARSEGMVSSTRAAIERVEHHIGTIDMMMGCDCIYRKLDAQYRNAIERMESLYQKHNFVGFNSFGEQYNAMHVNQTFTGVAFGLPSAVA